MDRHFPFTSVVGQDDAKLALQLIAVDPRIGGVLLRGEKGSAKTTLARGLADLLPGSAPFIDLPLGATEDRLIGTLDLAKMLTKSELGFTPGLLAAADGGVLYVDEINLLADHLVDTLLDVSVSGVNRIERDGVSHRHEARFVLIGSMNPEEGELRPQLLDRFGLSVQITASTDPVDRAEAVRRRLDFDGVNVATTDEDSTREAATQSEADQLRLSLANARPATVPDALIESAAKLALAVGAEGLRADIVLCRAAAAHAGLHGRTVADEDDLRRVAPLVLAHRSRRNPFDPPVLPPEALDDAINDALDDPAPDDPAPTENQESDADEANADPDSGSGSQNDASSDDSEEQKTAGDQARTPMPSGDDRRPPTASLTSPAAHAAAGRRSVAESDRGRLVREVPFDPASSRPIAVAGTVRQLADRRRIDPTASLEVTDVRQAVKERPSGSLLILVVDTSGSMGANERAELATGTAFGLLGDAYERRDHVAVIAFSGGEASVVLAPTGSVEVARHRLTKLETGGTTPLAAGLRQALEVARARKDQERTPFVVVISDGRASGAPDAFDDALVAADGIRKAGINGLVLDCETGVPKLGLAPRLAQAMQSQCIAAVDLDPATASSTIRIISQEVIDAR